MAAVAFKVQCHSCSRWKHEHDVIRLVDVVMCGACLEHHEKTMDAFCRGGVPPGCFECGITFRELPEDQKGNVQMALAVKDGIYQMLCLPCESKYEQKRRDLFRGTQYGHQILGV